MPTLSQTATAVLVLAWVLVLASMVCQRHTSVARSSFRYRMPICSKETDQASSQLTSTLVRHEIVTW